MCVRQKHGTDWLAAFVMAVVFALLFLALASIGLGIPIPFVDKG